MEKLEFEVDLDTSKARREVAKIQRSWAMPTIVFEGTVHKVEVNYHLLPDEQRMRELYGEEDDA